MFSSIGPFELIVVLVLALLLFGNRLPETMRSLGRSVNEFKRGMREVDNEARDTENKPPDAPKA